MALTTRIRLARNIRGLPFPSTASAEWRQKTAFQAAQAISEEFPFWQILSLDSVSPQMRECLFEQHLISHQLVLQPLGSLVCLSPEARFVVMINEEDHLRFQLLLPGLQANSVWPALAEVEQRLEKHIEYAFHNQYGYLTTCLTNLGTGLRASVMLHVPALTWMGGLAPTLAGWSHRAIEFRGIFGEGSNMDAGFIQLSNKMTLGSNIATICDHVHRSAQNLIKIEREARNHLASAPPVPLLNSIRNSVAILANAQFLSTVEASFHLSHLRLGSCLGLTPSLSPTTLLELLVGIRPAHLQRRVQHCLGPLERDRQRAVFLRSQIQTFIEDTHDG